MLNWSRMTVYRKVAKYGVGRPADEEPLAESMDAQNEEPPLARRMGAG
jgi:hypothetical protein